MSPVELEVLVLEFYLSNGSPDTTMFLLERLEMGKKASESNLRADPRLVLRPGKALTAQRWEKYVISNVLWSSAEREIRLQRWVRDIYALILLTRAQSVDDSETCMKVLGLARLVSCR